ncbi:MAG: ATP-binding protein [Bacteroidetes bacterium]|jgi:serine/threonine-protein kinase RsbW|nr:ATP-binding protein [Bacteroidota bacterium]
MKEGYSIIKKIHLPTDYNSLVDVEALVGSVCEKLGVVEDAYGNVLIAVTEAVNNAIEHGNEMNKDLSVEVSVGDDDSSFCFNVMDQGNGFDYTNLPDPTSPENLLKENGRGIFLMKNLADEVEFDAPGNSVNMYFNK